MNIKVPVVYRFIPLKTVKLNGSSYPRWFNTELKNLIRKEKAAHSVFRKSLFAQFVSSVYEKNNRNFSINFIPDKEINDHGLKASIAEVFEHISQINSSSNYGPDEVPSILFKNCVFTISLPLILLFQLSLYYSHFQNWLVNGIELIIAEECVTNVLLKRFLTS